MILLFLIQCILNVLLFIIMITASGLPGGAVGMMPMLLMIVVGIQFVIGSILYLPFRKRIKSGGTVMLTLLTFTILHEIVFRLVTGNFAIMAALEQGINGQVGRAFFASYIIALVMTGFFYIFRKYSRVVKYKNKRLPTTE